MSKILKSRTLPLDTRLRVLKCYVIPVLTYGSESWTITATLRKKLEAIEMWFLRRMLRISWTEHVKNEEVLRRSKCDRFLLSTIRKNQLSFLGHVMRKEGLEELALTGMINGKRGRGRPRMMYLRSIAEWTAKSEQDLLRTSKDRKRWKSMIADVLGGHGTRGGGLLLENIIEAALASSKLVERKLS